MYNAFPSKILVFQFFFGALPSKAKTFLKTNNCAFSIPKRHHMDQAVQSFTKIIFRITLDPLVAAYGRDTTHQLSNQGS